MITRLALLAAALAMLPQSAPFRVETRLVVLEATVKNNRGEHVTGLGRDTFTVLEDGKRQPIVLFRSDEALVIITDGNDNASVTALDQILTTAEQHDIVVYAVGLLSDQDPHAGRLRHDLTQLTEATGGLAYFPMNVEQIGEIALQMARQIRMQYTIGYTPLNQSLDGSYRKIRVKARASEPLTVRTRAGYRASPSSS